MEGSRNPRGYQPVPFRLQGTVGEAGEGLAVGLFGFDDLVPGGQVNVWAGGVGVDVVEGVGVEGFDFDLG